MNNPCTGQDIRCGACGLMGAVCSVWYSSVCGIIAESVSPRGCLWSESWSVSTKPETPSKETPSTAVKRRSTNSCTNVKKY